MGLTQYALWLARHIAGPAGWPAPISLPPPPDAGSAEWRQDRYTLALAGGSTTATLYTPPASQGVVILLHGGGATQAAAWPWANALLAAGLAALTLDLDGHGSNNRSYTTPTAAAEAALAAVKLLQDLGLAERVGLLGASLGGVVALKAMECLRQPLSPEWERGAQLVGGGGGEGKIHALALLATPHAATLRQLLTPHMLRAIWEGQCLPGAVIRRATPRGRLALFRDALAGEKLLDAAFGLASRPLLLVYGAYDPFAPLSQGQALQRAHGHAELWSVQASHAGTVYDKASLQRMALWFRSALDTPPLLLRL